MEGELLAQLAMLLNAGEPSMFGRVATVATMGTIATATDTHQGVHRNHRHQDHHDHHDDLQHVYFECEFCQPARGGHLVWRVLSIHTDLNI